MLARIAQRRSVRRTIRFIIAGGTALGVFSCKDTTGPITPETPTGVAVALITPSTARVTWNAAADPASVKILNVFRNGTKIAEVNGPLYFDNGLAELVT